MKKRWTKVLVAMLATSLGFTNSISAELPQVWDFGAQQLSGYNNRLSADEINSWFPGQTAGTTGVTLGSITANDSVNFIFDGAGKTNHRYRTTNKALTRYDEKSLNDISGNVYTGYIYSNSSSTSSVYIQQTYNVNDKVEFFVGSNGAAATYKFVDPDGNETDGEYTSAAKIEKLTFYIKKTGNHKLYCSNEKLVVARIVRTLEEKKEVSGSFTAPLSTPSGCKLLFQNTLTGDVTEVIPSENSYSVSLAKDYSYTVKFVDSEGKDVSVGSYGYIITEGKSFTVTDAMTNNITISTMELCKVTGSFTGITNADLAKATFNISLPEGKSFSPELIVNSGDLSYSLTVEKDVNYTMSVSGVDDYNLNTTSIQYSADATEQEIIFSKKPVYTVIINPTVATSADLSSATFTFTNINEPGYVYSFTGTDGIELRDGIYSVKVSNAGAFIQLLTSNVKVNGETVTKTIDFSADIKNWTFTDTDFSDYNDGGIESSFKTLITKGASANKSTYLTNKTGYLKIPVKGDCKITIKSCYEAHFKVGENILKDEKSGSTSQIDESVYQYSGGEGYVQVDFFGNTSYLTEITITEVVDYAETITVGADKQYQTITEALAAIAKMPRTSDQRVTVLIDPGNYEETPTVNVDNVTFKNASATPSIALKNAGVDIDENAVRITSYYGCGYDYASMASDYSWNARALQVNKENGYPAVKNQGGGSVARLWNSTTLVTAKGFIAENIIFENSFNQYISKKESEDLVVNSAGSNPSAQKVDQGLIRPTTVGNTDVQDKKYRERASAIGFSKTADKVILNNCRVVGRQDGIYGDQGVRVAAYKGVYMGACDYIFGGFTFVAYQADLSMLVSEDKDDVAYITASKNTSGRGYLFYNCHITSAIPEVEMVDTEYAKPGLFGRPWDNNAETVFCNTIIDSTSFTGKTGLLIENVGWNSGLTAGSGNRSVEYNSMNSDSVAINPTGRASFSRVLSNNVLADGTEITLYNFTKGNDNWDPFKDLGVSTDTKIAIADNGIKVAVIKNSVNLSGIDVPTQAKIFAIGGVEYASETLNANATINLPSGFFVVVTENKNGISSHKVIIP